MNYKTLLSLCLFFIYTLVNGQQKDVPSSVNMSFKERVKQELGKLQKEFKYKDSIYALKLKDIEEHVSKIDTNYDYNAIRDSISSLQNGLYEICNKQKLYKQIAASDFTSDTLNIYFDDKLCVKFQEKIDKKNKSISNIVMPKELTYLNAYNFDFNNSGNSGYFGHLSAFFPLIKDNDVYYINAGLLKANYTSLQSMDNSTERIDKVLVNPLNDVAVGVEYLKQYNVYKSNLKISSYSVYIQPMYRIIPTIKNLFVHLHVEFLIYDAEYITNVTTIRSENKNVLADELADVFLPRLETAHSDKNNYYGIYTGAGITGNFKVSPNPDYGLDFMFQATTGWNNLQPGNGSNMLGSINVDNNNADLIGNMGSQHKGFYWVNAYFNNTFSGLNLQIGTQIRGNFDNPALYVFYVGISSDLKKVASLFKA